MEFITEYAGAIILGLVVFLLIAYTIRGQFQNKGSCGCGNKACPKSTACATSKHTPCEQTINENSKS